MEVFLRATECSTIRFFYFCLSAYLLVTTSRKYEYIGKKRNMEGFMRAIYTLKLCLLFANFICLTYIIIIRTI